jgi:hypothetical protein
MDRKINRYKVRWQYTHGNHGGSFSPALWTFLANNPNVRFRLRFQSIDATHSQGSYKKVKINLPERGLQFTSTAKLIDSVFVVATGPAERN